MRTKSPQIQISEFVELVAITASESKTPNFDILIEGKIDINNYCDALINKVCILNNTNYSDFLDYQCKQKINRLLFLEKFQELIINNEKVFTTKCLNLKMSYFFDLLDKKHKELQSTTVKKTKTNIQDKYINAKSDDKIFCYKSTKITVEKIEKFNDKISFLNNEIFDYDEADIILNNPKLCDYKIQCEKLKVRIETIRKQNLEIELENLQNLNKLNLNPKPQFKIKLCGPINIITDAYKQMMFTAKPNGVPYIQNKIKEIAEFICDNHLDDKGNEISYQTVLTYLSPTRIDKNPNNNWKVTIKSDSKEN